MNTHDIKRYAVSGDIAYPIHEDPEGEYVTYEDHVAAIEADRKRRGEPVAYLDLGMGGYIDLGSDLTDEQLASLPRGRHMLAIVGTYGVDGYTEADPPPAAGFRTVGEIRLDANRHPYACLLTGYDEHGDQWKEGTPIYAATQPAEPVKVPSDDERAAQGLPPYNPRLPTD